MRDHRIQVQYNNYPKLLLRYIRCTDRLGGHCIHGTYFAPPVAERLRFFYVEISITNVKTVISNCTEVRPLWWHSYSATDAQVSLTLKESIFLVEPIFAKKYL